ncbi:hypothetical protein [Lederbergia galactosidilytica]|uniref:hypothetical protein n=1 Tax=Lederbergia galactosidilytica TaxID=217031 RepID=UPI0007DB3847|nr:hypothetical protein [Lederbergia galactosidilytica]
MVNQDLYDKWYETSSWSIDKFSSNTPGNGGPIFAWNWSYSANSLIDMYRATSEEKYLNTFVPQATYIFTQTDDQLGIESFTGLGVSLPAWSDRGHYTAGEYNYIYPVHTGMILLPILRFVDTVKRDKLEQYYAIADDFIEKAGKALAIHNRDDMWIDLSETEGFYLGHPHGEGKVSEANKIGIPNRIFAYLAAAGLYDKITGKTEYTPRITKSLNYFKNYLLKYDKENDAYYWSYWEYSNKEGWEDISHAALTVYGIYILHKEAGFSTFTEKDFKRFSNIVHKIVKVSKLDSQPKVMQNIHQDDKSRYLSFEENRNYFTALHWSFLASYDETILDELQGIYKELSIQDKPTVTSLYNIGLYLSTLNKVK